MKCLAPSTLSLLIACSITAPVSADVELDVSGRIGIELRTFNEDGRYDGQDYTANISTFMEPSLAWQWNQGNDLAVITPYFRIDQHDSERTHADLREFYWLHVADDWEVKAGISHVFWGVTEFQHLSDVINQTDLIEDLDGEDKLGQPMLKLSLVRDAGIFDFYLLPGFREQTLAGKHGRFRPSFVIDNNDAIYQSSAEERHIDAAIRWSHSTGPFDLGAYLFKGTNREATLTPRIKGAQISLIPYYSQMTQIGGDLQYTTGNWLWKAEGIWRDSQSTTLSAIQAGAEYTFYGIADSATDLGLLIEYGWDNKGKNSTRVYQNDISVGARFGFNDIQSTELLIGITYDVDYRSTSVGLEGSRRLGDSWKISVDARFFNAGDINDPLYLIDDDNYIGLTLERYF